MRKTNGIRTVCVIAVLVLILALAGCTGKPDPNAGLYEAVSASSKGIVIEVDEVFEEGMTIELKSGQKAVYTCDGESCKLKWTLEGEDFHAEGDGAVLDGTLKDGVMDLVNILDSGVNIRLECKDLMGGSKLGPKGEDGSDPTESGKEDITGRYDAVAAMEDGNDEVWLEEGEYLVVNDDHTIKLFVADQNLTFDTTFENNKFYIEGDTKVGQLNKDGSISLNLSDSVVYIFAREGSDKWAEWRKEFGYDEEVEEETTDAGENKKEESADGKEGGSKGGIFKSGKLGDKLNESAESGEWKLYMVEQNGRTYTSDELKAKDIESWIEMDEGGSGTIDLVGDIYKMEWKDGLITVPDNGNGGSDEYRYTISNEYLVLIDEDMVLTFIKSE